MKVTEEGDHVLVAISGDMDMSWLERNESTLEGLIASQPTNLVLDVSNVAFLDSIGRRARQPAASG